MSLRAYVEQQQSDAPAPYASARFKKLQREWYAKLAASGFVDAELHSSSHYDTRLTREYYRGGSNGEYYRVLGWWEHDRVWSTRRGAHMWRRLASGSLMGEVSRAYDYSPDRLRRFVQRELALAKTYYRMGTER